MENGSRFSRDAYFGIIAAAAAMLAKCQRRQVGAVLVKENRIISTGYNGAPPGFQNCFGDKCVFGGSSCINTIHAEINCLTRSREVGDIIYCTDTPCINCVKALLSHNPNIRIVWMRCYDDSLREHFIYLHDEKNNVNIERMNLQDLQQVEKTIGFNWSEND